MMLSLLKKWWPVWSAALGCLALAVVWLSGPALEAVSWQERRNEHLGELAGDYRVGQIFTCPADGLARIEVLMGTYGGLASGRIDFDLAPAPAGPGPAARFSPGDGRPIPLEPGRTIGQIFRPQRPGLKGVAVLFSRQAQAGGKLDLRLIDVSGRELAARRVSLSDLPLRGWLELKLAPGQSALVGRSLSLAVTRSSGGAGLVGLRTSPVGRGLRGDVASQAGALVFRPLYPALAGGEPILVRGRAASLAVSDNAYHGFDFPPLADSAGRQFRFGLQAPEARSGDAVTVWALAEPGRAGLLIDGVPVEGAMAFRAFAATPRSRVWSDFAARTGHGGGWLILAGLIQAVGGLVLICGLAMIGRGSGRRR